MPATHRVEITRKGSRIGFLEIPELPQGEASLPDIEGNERGFAIVVEIEDAPAAALVFPWKGESIDIAEPVRWSAAHLVERDVPIERREFTRSRSLRQSPALLQLAGEIRPSRPEAEERIAFEFRLRESSEARQIPIRLEIDDENEHGSLHCRLAGEPFADRGLVRGSFRARSGEGDLRSEMSFDFRGWRRGFGEGYFSDRMRSREGTESGGGEFRFMFHTFGPGHGYGEGRFEGRGLGDFPLLWLIEQSFRRTRALERPVAFRIWIGAVRYASELGEAQIQLERINALAEGGACLSGAETRESLQWLASSLLEPRGSAYARAIGPLLERLKVSEEASQAQSQALNTLMNGGRGLSPIETSGALRLFASTLLQLRDPAFSRALSPVLERLPLRERAYRGPRQTVHDLSLQFDTSVSPETRMRFLVDLADQLSQAGGRLCFSQLTEERL